jgi:hypothetical protein
MALSGLLESRAGNGKLVGFRTRLNAGRTRLSRVHSGLSRSVLREKANNVGHCITLSVRCLVARDSFFLRVSIGSGATLASLSPARNLTGPPN